MKLFYESDEIAEQLQVKVRQVQRLARMGRIPHVRNGWLIRIPVSAWETWLEQQNQTALEAVKEGDHAEAAAACAAR